jgi:hypothetical protein
VWYTLLQQQEMGGPEAVPYQVLSQITKKLLFVFVTSVSKQEYTKYAYFKNANDNMFFIYPL